MKLLDIGIFINVQKDPPENFYVFESIYVNIIYVLFKQVKTHSTHFAACFFILNDMVFHLTTSASQLTSIQGELVDAR